MATPLTLCLLILAQLARGGEFAAGPIVNPANQHTYYLLLPSTGTEAEQKAAQMGGHLVTINDAREQDWVSSTFSRGNRILWIGYYRTAEGFTWTSREPTAYENWRATEPNNWAGSEDRVVMTTDNGTWNDVSDNTTEAAIYGVVELPFLLPWWTWQKMLWLVGSLTAATLFGLAWITVLSRQKAILTRQTRLLEDEVTHRKEVEKDLEEAHNRQRENAEQQFHAVLQERSRIAQELHDSLQQSLTGAALQLDMAAEVVLENPELTQRHLELARTLMRNSQEETRRSILDLSSQSLEGGGLLSALKTAARQSADGSNVAIEVIAKGDPRPLPILLENNLFRIAQEALTNAMKHSQANRVVICVEYQEHSVSLEIQDDGHGFDATQFVPDGQHFGLQGIRERVRKLAGEFDLASNAPQGTQLRVNIPIFHQNAASDTSGSQPSSPVEKG